MRAFELGRQCSCLLILAGRSFSDPSSCRRNSLGHSFSSFLQIKPNFCILFHMTPLFDIQSCHARPCPGHLSSEVALLFLCYRASIMRSGGRVLLIIRTVWRSTTKILASLCLLSLPHLHTNPTGTTGPARILRILPRLPPSQPTHHLSRAKCGGLPPHLLRSFSLFSFLHICMILARQYASNVPVS